MLSLLYNYLRSNLIIRTKASDNKEQQDERKLDELLEELRRDDEPERAQEATITEARSPVELQYSCTKNEGVVTSLDDSGGIINGIHEFTRKTAQSNWRNLKVGSKLSFLIFEGSVRRIELIDAGWDDDEVVKIPNSNAIGYNTDYRTVIGTLIDIENEILVIDTGESTCVPLEDHPQLRWDFVPGDSLRLECIIQEDEMSWKPTSGSYGKILEVKSVKPNREKHEIGSVSAVCKNYAIIDESVVIRLALVKEQLKVMDQYEYEAIESSCSEGGRNYEWRLTKLIKKVDAAQVYQIADNKAIQMHDATFSFRQELNRELRHSVSVYNSSAAPVTLKRCEISSHSGLVRVDRTELNIQINQNSGKFNIYLKVTPKHIGSFVEELIADFGEFQKKCMITVDIHDNNLASRNRNFKKDRNNNSEVIPGQRLKDSPRFIEIRIKDYMVLDEFRQNDFKKKVDLIVQDLYSSHSFLFEQLNRENYVAKMRYCIYLEEIAMEIQFAKYKLERAHFDNKEGFLRLEVEGVAEKRPSISIGDSIQATDLLPSNRNKPIYEGCIHKVEQNAILVKFHAEFHQNHNRKDYRIDFFFSRTAFKRQQHALDKTVSQNGLGFDFLFPLLKNFIKNPQVDVKLLPNENMEIYGKEFEFFNNKLNKYQKDAVMNVLRGESRPLPYIIYGPPGTGKTSTVTECIEQIADKIPWSRIIVAAPSNSAANLIVERLIASGRLKGGDFIRFVSFNQIEKDLIPTHLKKYCATVDIGFDDGKAHNTIFTDSGVRLNCSKSIIVQYRIYISTLSSLGPLMQIKFLHDHFTHVIIDEAGQTVEPESLIPISFVSKNKGQVVLAGDPKQLGPVLVSQVSKLCGFDKSFLERLSEHEYYLPIYGPDKDEFDSRFVTKLKKNYRSLPSILGIYNKLYYRDELEAQVSDEESPEMQLLKSIDSILWNRENADRKCGVYFINVSNGRNERTQESSSWFNNEEASRIFLFACKLKKLGISLKDVGIITPYTLQGKNLKRIINDSMPGCELKVGTVEEFQGQERQIILVSTVRTNHHLLQTDFQFGLGFLQCPKRMNVAISRARALLVVFGKESILSRDDNWRYLIQFAKEKGCYMST